MKKVLFIVHDNEIDPLGVMNLISNSSNAIFDILFIKESNFEDKIKEIDPKKFNIIAFSTITGTHLFHNKIAEYFKQINNRIISIMGGPHPTFFPKEAISLLGIDYICVGEGIFAFNKFLNGIESSNIISKKTISNFSYCNLEKLADVSKINPPDRKIVYSKDRRIENSIRNFMGSFGCPYNCSYCFNKSYHDIYNKQERVRYKEPTIFVNEIIQTIKVFETSLIYIQDDTFITNKKWFKEVTQLIKDKINIPYHCHIRCDITDEIIIKTLKETGCKSVTFAVETANEEYRVNYLNRKMSNDKIIEVSQMLNRYGIMFRIENMVGLPFSSMENDLETIKLNARCNPTIGWASLYQPYPNTKLGNLCTKNGLWDEDIDNINPSFFESSCLKLRNKKEIEKLQKIFSLAVNYWLIRKVIRLLIILPCNSMFKKVYVNFKNKMYKKLYGE